MTGSLRPVSTLCDVILNLRKRGEGTAVQWKIDGVWQSSTWSQYYSSIERIGLGLKDLGLESGDRIGILSNTRIEWSLLDYAALGVGAIVVPIYHSSTAEDLEVILNDSECKILCVENRSSLRVVNLVKGRCPSVQMVILIQGTLDEKQSWLLTWEELQQRGSARLSRGVEEFSDSCSRAQETDTATIIYTSGTTGRPKGVVLTHVQCISEVREAFTYLNITSEDRSLSFLPYAHILGRVEHWGQCYIGYTMAFAESIEKIRQNLKDIQPTILMAVPRIFEKIYGLIWSQAESNFISLKAFRWGIAVGLKVGDRRIAHESIPLSLLLPYELAEKTVFARVRSVFGGRLRFAVSGGAPLSREIALFFHAAGVLILEGYGLTETTAAITVNAPFDYRFGSVGKAFGDTEIKIAEDGEILIRSKKVMKEYYKDEVATRAAIEPEGWFHTGDIGEILSSGHLVITDRKKDLIKTAGGKYVAPQKLEGLLKNSSLISNVLIHGDQKKFIVALLTLDPGQLKNWAQNNAIENLNSQELSQNPKLLEEVRKIVAGVNKQLGSYETIKRFSILPHDFTVEAGELTPSLKVKRKFLDKKFRTQIEALYS